MTDLTRQEIIDAQLARQWAEWNKSCEVSSPEIQAAANFILAHTTPPTMAEIEWDEEEHFLAEAKHPKWGKVVMLYEFDEFISVMQTSDGPKVALGDVKERFTPTGRRYVLQEGEE